MTVIRPAGTGTPLRFDELWEYRELLYFLVWRNVKVRYRQTAFGAAWAVIQPFFAMVVFTIFFGELAGVPSEGLPYPIFAYTALVPWTFFANALTQASNSLVEHEPLITEVYFPRLFIPLAAVLVGAVDFAVAFAMLLGMMLLYGIAPTGAAWMIPLFVLLATAAALGVGLWLSALNVRYRDVRHAIPFLVQLWLLATPIAYSSNLLPAPWRTAYGLNPMAGVVEGFRWALLGQPAPPLALLAVSSLTCAGLLVGGLYFFQYQEETFADVV